MTEPNPPDILSGYETAVHDYARSLLAPYTLSLAKRFAHASPAGKEVNDPVWGTLTLSPLEVLLLDSPLVQRLRRVRQLGVAHFVYPGAVHSRLEHSLGALHQAQRLIAALNSSKTTIAPAYARLIRAAALLHDVGHGIMSHVSENALQYSDVIEDLRLEFITREQTEASLSEINAFLLMDSEAFAEMLAKIESIVEEKIGLPDVAESLQRCITGRVLDPASPMLQQIISGPFDVDKLDYMTRDPMMCGVPVVTDVNRLVSKCRAVTLARQSAPLSIQKLTNADQDVITVIGIERSGNRTLDELTLGRTLLFDKLYRHHKVRSVEAMVAAAFLQLCRASERMDEAYRPALIALARSDEDLIGYGENNSELTIGLALTEEESAVLEDLGRRLRDRRLFVRALSFSRKMPGDPYDEDEGHAAGLSKLLLELEDPSRRLAIADELASEVEQVLGILGMDDELAKFPGGIRNYLWIDGPRTVDHLRASAKAMLISRDESVVPFEVDAPETPQWANAYHQTRDTGFIFAPEEVAAATALAAERYLRTRFGIRIPIAMMPGLQLSANRAEDERATLSANGFYDSAPRDLLPWPAPLLRGDAPALMGGIAANLKGYMFPLIDPGREGRDRFEVPRVRDFLMQFEEDHLVAAALDILQSIELIGRKEVVAPLLQFLEAHPDYQEAALVPLGKPAESSSIVAYFAMDASVRYPGVVTRSLGQALAEGRPLLFVDDFIGSGRQASSIVRAWLGDSSLASELGEEREQLVPDLHEALRRRPQHYLFAAGLDDGRVYLRDDAFARFEMSGAGVTVGRHEATLPKAFTDVADPAMQALRERCEDIGRQLLANQGADKAAGRALGYGNLGLLVVFPYNTPSQTLTCLWSSGTVDGKPWEALLPRRRKR